MLVPSEGNCAKDPLLYFTLSTMTRLPNQSTTGQEVNYSLASLSMSMDGLSAIKCLNVIVNYPTTKDGWALDVNG
jgi:hypothetical protein